MIQLDSPVSYRITVLLTYCLTDLLSHCILDYEMPTVFREHGGNHWGCHRLNKGHRRKRCDLPTFHQW